MNPSTPTSSALTIVQEYHHAWTSGDVEQAMVRVADDVVCRAPGQTLTGKDAYRGYIAAFAPALTGLTDIGALADDRRVALFYYPHTAATDSALAAEYFTVRDGLIVESYLTFDRLSFAAQPDHS